eukprot:22375-Eustigmatos_ZCMA.PRE.1
MGDDDALVSHQYRAEPSVPFTSLQSAHTNGLRLLGGKGGVGYSTWCGDAERYHRVHCAHPRG